MQKINLIILTFLFANFSFGQKNENKIFEASKGKWGIPFAKYTKIEYYKTFEHMLDVNIDSSVSIFTDSAYKIKAMHSGEVILVSEIDSGYNMVLVKYGSYYLTYSNVSSVFVKKGDVLSKNANVGIVGKDFDGIYCLDILLQKDYQDICPKNWINWKKSKK